MGKAAPTLKKAVSNIKETPPSTPP